MSTPTRKAADGQDTSTAAEAAEREDPMTSFDPEADRGAEAGTPAEHRPSGNGTTGTPSVSNIARVISSPSGTQIFWSFRSATLRSGELDIR